MIRVRYVPRTTVFGRGVGMASGYWRAAWCGMITTSHVSAQMAELQIRMFAGDAEPVLIYPRSARRP